MEELIEKLKKTSAELERMKGEIKKVRYVDADLAYRIANTLHELCERFLLEIDKIQNK